MTRERIYLICVTIFLTIFILQAYILNPDAPGRNPSFYEHYGRLPNGKEAVYFTVLGYLYQPDSVTGRALHQEERLQDEERASR